MSEAEVDAKLQSVASFDEIKTEVADSIKAEIESKMSELQTQIQDANARLDDLQTKLTERNAEILTLQNEITALKTEGETKDNALKMANERISTLSGELASHKAGASGVNSALDEITQMPGASNKAGGVSFSAAALEKYLNN